MAEEGEPARKRQRGGVEELNVGGVPVTTTRETLVMLPYFRALFHQEEERGLLPVTDNTGRIFVDRNGELFKIILDYLRTFRRPPKEVLETRGLQLKDEAEYFGCQELLNEISGESNLCKWEHSDREIRDLEWDWFCEYRDGDISQPWEERLINVFDHLDDFVIKPRADMRYPLLFEKTCLLPSIASRSVYPKTVGEFEKRFNRIGRDLLDVLRDPCVVIAGGSIVAALVEDDDVEKKTGHASHDVDVFLCDVTPQRARALMEEILSKYHATLHHPLTATRTLVRSNAALTVFTGPSFAPLQIMLTLYRDPLEVVMNFDVDCCGVLYLPHARKLLCTPRCQRALNFRTNLVSTEMRNDFYEKRLYKYATRGFCVAVPGLELDHVDDALTAREYVLLEATDSLLRLNPAQASGKETVCASGMRTEVTRVRSARVVPHSLERMVVLDRVAVRRVAMRPPDLTELTGKLPEGGFHFSIEDEGPAETVCWVRFGDDGEAGWSGSDVTRLRRLMRGLALAHVRGQHPQAENWEALPESFLRYTDGGNLGAFAEIAMERLAQNRQLGFVYGRLCSNRAGELQPLEFVCDAEKEPLRTDLSDEEFAGKYGVAKRLEFRPLTPQDYASFGRVVVAGKVRIGDARPRRPLMAGVYKFAP